MFDLTQVKENSFGVIPEGLYSVVSEEAKVKSTKSGTGEYINVKFRVAEGEHEGKFLYTMFNTKNDNPKAVEIGLGQLKTFLKVANAKDPNQLKDVADLVGYKAIAVVKIKNDSYGEGNVISYFKPWSIVGSDTKGKQTNTTDIPF